MKILVIGDSCKDVFIYGTANRLCPEAPVPVFIPKRKTETGGMAANVYENIESLSVDVDLITNYAYNMTINGTQSCYTYIGVSTVSPNAIGSVVDSWYGNCSTCIETL